MGDAGCQERKERQSEPEDALDFAASLFGFLFLDLGSAHTRHDIPGPRS